MPKPGLTACSSTQGDEQGKNKMTTSGSVSQFHGVAGMTKARNNRADKPINPILVLMIQWER
ncbi:hypothetical protein [Paraflavitalea speifideaquila]|uniref:hypothetical protein n=1 Tax=Paraflavitalea speifideaquila TaxID=3076558 RepID=UPI0028E88245|nr:hypothetical protein [Paraflavitalea speifideiaquila]